MLLMCDETGGFPREKVYGKLYMLRIARRSFLTRFRLLALLLTYPMNQSASYSSTRSFPVAS